MKISTRIRFEVLKRDGFRCRYCGTEPFAAPLHVDHVIPKSKGGTDDPAHLVAACAACNLGKSDVPLDETRFEPPDPEAVREHAEQLHEFLQAVDELEEAKYKARQMMIDVWCRAAATDAYAYADEHGMPEEIYARLDSIFGQHGFARTIEAIKITAARGFDGERALRYVYGVLRKMADQET